MREKFLPLGSIVSLADNKKIMIIGYLSAKYQDGIAIYDYLGCGYPEGLLLPNNFYYFNHSDIINTIFMGYDDDSYGALNRKLSIELKDEKTDQSIMEDAELVKITDPFVDNDSTIFNSELSKIKENIHTNDGGYYLKDLCKKLEEIKSLGKKEKKVTDLKSTEKELNLQDDFQIPHYEFDENGIIINV